ncbi:GNAT family N-acetyltransferase [Nicoliella spurrieriana]|uniref:GNAT family N-acetyltransferase n=1 Tax=Nicoliella spurrieriana TaxID=2925830 RepID=A0A976RRC1_9LACO|nr:GNAT family N-acetyltransferase [Nicoliella spurrieriana]UQS86335.1 GNAT family N-acetyltransferase [Nicoliella spurrieriana]
MSLITVRPLLASDDHAFWHVVRSKAVASAAGFSPAIKLADAQAMLNAELTSGHGYAVAFDRQVVGFIFLYPQVSATMQPDHCNLEIGFLMHPDFQNRGIMGSALQILLGRLSRNGRVKTLLANVQIANGASQKILLNNHFQQVGRFVNLNGESIEQFQISL